MSGGSVTAGRPLVDEASADSTVRRDVGAMVFLSLALLAGLRSLAWLPLTGDEPHHVEQIRLLMRGEWRIIPKLTTVPGYHAIIAAVGWVLGLDNVAALRACSFVLSLATLVVLFAYARTASGERASERLAQIAFLPFLFPFFFLLYTDVAAIGFF